MSSLEFLLYSQTSYCRALKEQCREMDIFFDGLNILISTVLPAYALMVFNFQGLSKAFDYPIQLSTFLLL